MSVSNLSVFFPAFNEEGNIAKTVENAAMVLKNINLKWEIVVVDDGSKDRTREIADKIAKENNKIKVVSQANGGYGMALRTGFKSTRYDWIVYTDADGQFDFSEIDKFLSQTDQADYIIGYRIKRNDPIHRLLFAKGWVLSVFILFGVWVKDMDCGFKMIHRKVLKAIGPLESTRGAMINAELLIKTKRKGFRITQVGVNHYPRKSGKPSGANLAVITRSYSDLFNLWWKLR